MQKVAAIDCGTNSIRLLVAQKDENGALIDCVDRLVRINRLGFGVDKTKRFDEEALKRTFEFEREFKEVIDKEGVLKENIRFIATSAARDAQNRDIFFETTRDILGIIPEVISGDTEADLSFNGVVSHQTQDQSNCETIVVDLGGGSTEIIVGKAGKREAAFSMDIGSVRLTERFWGFDNAATEELMSDAKTWIHEVFDHGFAQIEKQGAQLNNAEKVVGVAGTVTTLTAAALKLEEYSREKVSGAILSIDEVCKTADMILKCSKDELRSLKFIHPGRVDVIQAGALIWKELLIRLAKNNTKNLNTVATSEHDILDGIALSILNNKQ